MTEPTVETHPYQVGRVVYATLAEAIVKAAMAQELYPAAKVVVIDRREMVQCWPLVAEVAR